MSPSSAPAYRTVDSAPMAEDERTLRQQLAACYRLIARFRMTDLIFTHISARLPGPGHRFLLNPYGLMFEEITASNLVVVDLDGRVLSANGHGANPAGFVIHSAIHGAREDAQCVLHTHTRAGVAVSTLKCGLLPINQFALQFYNRVAYHDYEGIALDLDERARLVADLGDKQVMILRNHGLLTVGRSIPEAFILMFYLERSCEVQIAAQSTGTELILPSPEVCARTERQYNGSGVDDPGDDEGWALTWSALLRMLDREDPSYKD